MSWWLALTINKIQQIQTFLKQMDKPRSLDALLRIHDIPAEEFFQTLGIAQQIRNNLTRFVKYCRSHRAFTRRLIVLALNVSASDLEQDPSLKTASHAITEVLSNEEPALAELFFEELPQPAPEGADIPEELEGGIQSEAERLLNFSDEEEEPQQQRPVELQPLELAELSLEILREPQRNPTCLGHLHKLYSFLIRHNPLPVLNYFQQHPQALQLLLANLRYSSVSSLVAQLLTSEDKTRVYAHEALKRRIIEFALEEMLGRLEDEEFFDGVMILVEEILNTTKQSYYEYFEDFKRVSNLLVCSATLARFLQILFALHEPAFRSAARFLQFLFCRINSQREDNSYYHRGEETEPSMNFEVEIFFQQLPQLVGLVPQMEAFNSITKIHYLSFLEALLVAAQAKNYSFSITHPAFLGLLDCLNRQKKGGLFKNKLYTLITAVIARATPQQATEFIQTHSEVWEQYFAALKSANYANTKTYNKNQSSAFDLSLINQLSKKNGSVITAAGKATGKDLARMCKKYETKIGNVQTNSAFVLEEESSFMSFSFDNRNENSSSNPPAFSLNFVGKNSISIPILQLPDRYHSAHLQEDKERGDKEPLHINGIKEIIEIEEVVSLTDTIKSLTIHDREDCHIERPPELSRNEHQLDSPQKPPKRTVEIQPKVALKPVEVVEVKEKAENGVGVVIRLKEKHDHLEQARFFAKYLPIFA